MTSRPCFISTSTTSRFDLLRPQTLSGQAQPDLGLLSQRSQHQGPRDGHQNRPLQCPQSADIPHRGIQHKVRPTI